MNASMTYIYYIQGAQAQEDDSLETVCVEDDQCCINDLCCFDDSPLSISALIVVPILLFCIKIPVQKNWLITAGAKNVFDEKPQPIGSNSPEKEDPTKFGATNTLPQFYDVFGRTFFLKVTSYF